MAEILQDKTLMREMLMEQYADCIRATYAVSHARVVVHEALYDIRDRITDEENTEIARLGHELFSKLWDIETRYGCEASSIASELKGE